MQSFGNEVLKPLAVEGDEEAIRILKSRGNVIDGEGRLVKTSKRTRHVYVDGVFIKNEVIEEIVRDGRLVERRIDGVVVPPAVGEV